VSNRRLQKRNKEDCTIDLEARMRASGDWTGDAALTRADLLTRLLPPLPNWT